MKSIIDNAIKPLKDFNADYVVSLSDNIDFLAQYIANELNCKFINTKDLNHVDPEIHLVLVTDVTLSGTTLNKGKEKYAGATITTFAYCGNADHVISEKHVCPSDAIPLLKKAITPKKSLLDKLFLPFTLLLGALSLLWVILRTGTNPKRVSYPCQQVAIPLAFTFLAYIGGLVGFAWSYQKAKKYIHNSKYILASLFGVVAITCFVVFSSQEKAHAYTPADGSNNPMGTAKGIFPGRVAWAHNPDATDWIKNTNNTPEFWWADNHTNQNVVDNMLRQDILSTAGKSNEVDAWDAIFKYFNNNNSKGNVGYVAGEKIAIKINCNNTHNSHTEEINNINPCPQLVLSLVRQLVNNAGVAPANITIYDATRYITNNIYNKVIGEFPNVVFVDQNGGDGRVARVWSANVVNYSQTNGMGKQVPTCVLNANYLIDMAILKQHPIAGVTLLAKNHCGTVNGIDHDWINPTNHGMDTYSPFVDILGSKQIGGKTVFNIIDALYGAFHSDIVPDKWAMAPFNNDWPSSILTSLDPVALSSVACDLLITERGTNLPNFVDRDLHEMAMCDKAPSGIKYDPNGTGGLASLGVHEHWNNPISRQYSRNLNPLTGKGIELVYITDNNTPPNVTLTSPTDKQIIDLGKSVTLSANATDADGTVVSVSFYNGTQLLYTDNTAPYTYTWNNVTEGKYSIKAIATDNKGASSVSSTSYISVVDPHAPPVAVAGVDQLLFSPTSTVSLDGSASYDPNMTTLTYLWTLVSGPNSPAIVSNKTAKTNITGLIPGLYIFKLAVSDGESTVYDDVKVTLISEALSNIALKKTATASNNKGNNNAAAAVDGSATTRWETAAADPQWLKVDLGLTYEITKVIIKWESANAQNYYVLTSSLDTDPNPATWSTLSTQTGKATGTRTDTINFTSGTARYISIYGTTRNTGYGYSIFELEVYGYKPIVTNVPLSYEENQFKLYPNPAVEQATINLPSDELWSINITDVSGRRVISTSVKGNIANILLSNIPSGLYFATITSKTHKLQKSLIIKK